MRIDTACLTSGTIACKHIAFYAAKYQGISSHQRCLPKSIRLWRILTTSTSPWTTR